MNPDLLTWPQRGQLWLRLGIRAALVIGAVLLTVFVAVPLVSLLMPFVLALVLAWLLNPVVRWLKNRLNISRKVISLAVLVLAFGTVGGLCYGLCWALVNQVISLFDNWQPILDSLMATVDNVGHWLDRLGDILPNSLVATGDDLVRALASWLESLDLSSQIAGLASWATGLVSGIPGFAVAVVAFLMASYFITSDYPRLRYLFTDQLPGNLRQFGSQVRRIFMEAFGGYLKSQLLLSLGVFAILTAGFLIIRQPYSLLLAFVLAVMDFIPIIGAGTVMVPWAAVDLITGDYRQTVELMVIWGVIVLFRQVGEPKILGGQTGLSPILSLVGIYAGMRLAGVLGMVVGPLLLLVCINLVKLGIFRPVAADLRLAMRDVTAILKGGAPGPSDGP